MKTLKPIALSAALAFLASVSVHAQALVSYSYPAAAPAGSGDPQPVPPPANETADATGSTSLGSGLGATGNSYIGGYLTAARSSYPTTLDAAVTSNFYYSFTITPAAGAEITLTNFDLGITTLYSSNNASTFDLESSATGFGSTAGNILASYQSTALGTDVSLLGAGFVAQTAPVEFRLYVYTAGGDYYAALQNGPLEIDGVATAAVSPTIPEPSTYFLSGLGLAALAFAVRKARLA